MLMYSLSAFALARAVLKTSTVLLLFVAMLFLSRYPILWLSTELLAGAFLSLAIAGLLMGWRTWLSGALLACAGLCKPDMMLPVLALMAFHLFLVRGRDGVRLAAGFGVVCIAVRCLPGAPFSALANIMRPSSNRTRFIASSGPGSTGSNTSAQPFRAPPPFLARRANTR
jgi:hypothetical protein